MIMKIYEDLTSHSWARVQPSKHLNWAPNPVTKYEERYFGLLLPKPHFNIANLLVDEIVDGDRIRKGFESEEKARKEDKYRVKQLRKLGGRYERELANRL